MGVLTDFFVASDDEMSIAFRGWAKPAPLLDEFVTRMGKNPFTGQMVELRSRRSPMQPEPAPGAVERGNYQRLPWIDQKGISTLELAHLAEIVMDWDHDYAFEEINGRMYYGPDGTSECVFELPAPFVERLAATSTEQHATLGARWAETERTKAATIKNEYTRERALARPDSEWIERLAALAKLAKVAT